MTPGLERLVGEMVRTARDLWRKGWAERNAGNVSIRLRPEEAPGDAAPPGDWRPIGAAVGGVAGLRFLVTGSGSTMRNVPQAPDRDLGVVEVDGEGAAFRALWGFGGAGLPTSELLPHLFAHAARIEATAGSDHVVIHTHPTNLIALTYAEELDTKRLTRLLWELHTECLVVFPEGIGFVDWRLPGSEDLARATAAVLRRRPMALWPHHGIVAAGPDAAAAFGLVETAEKAAQIYLAARAAGGVVRRLTTVQLAALAERFGVTPDPEILAG